MRSAGMIDIFVLSTWASHAHGACVCLQSQSPSVSLQTFPLTVRAGVRMHPRVYVCTIYEKTKGKLQHRLV